MRKLENFGDVLVRGPNGKINIAQYVLSSGKQPPRLEILGGQLRKAQLYYKFRSYPSCRDNIKTPQAKENLGAWEAG